MTEEVLIAGFGGQGVLLAGQILAHAAMDADMETTWFPSYGPEMRGGTANCTVVYSDEEIGSPIASQFDAVIALNQPSMERFEPRLRPGGRLLLNASMIPTQPKRTDIVVVRVPAVDLAKDAGEARAANVIMLGAYLATAPSMPEHAVIEALRETFSAKGDKVIQINLRALALGRQVAESQLPALHA